MKKIKLKEIPGDILHRKEFIKYHLLIRGYTLTALAKEYNVTKQQPTNALSMSYPKWEHIIAQKLGVKPQWLWPERYDEYGIPLKQMGRPKKSNVLLLNDSTVSRTHKVKNAGGVKHAQG